MKENTEFQTTGRKQAAIMDMKINEVHCVKKLTAYNYFHSLL